MCVAAGHAKLLLDGHIDGYIHICIVYVYIDIKHIHIYSHFGIISYLQMHRGDV